MPPALELKDIFTAMRQRNVSLKRKFQNLVLIRNKLRIKDARRELMFSTFRFFVNTYIYSKLEFWNCLFISFFLIIALQGLHIWQKIAYELLLNLGQDLFFDTTIPKNISFWQP